tara:strand:+ start:390 stop:608 length:219 start_codon:yes stop_codon:yes gene_type:complete
MSCKRVYHLTIAYDPETEEVEYLMETINEESDSEVLLLGTSDFSDYFIGDQDTDEEIKMILESFDNVEPGEA